MSSLLGVFRGPVTCRRLGGSGGALGLTEKGPAMGSACSTRGLRLESEALFFEVADGP